MAVEVDCGFEVPAGAAEILAIARSVMEGNRWRVEQLRGDGITGQWKMAWEKVSVDLATAAGTSPNRTRVSTSGRTAGIGGSKRKGVQSRLDELRLPIESAYPSEASDEALTVALDAEEGALAAVGRLRPAVREYLRENLQEGETICALVEGDVGQAIVGTERRLFVVKPGIVAGAARGVEATAWSYRNLVGIQLHKGVTGGSVIVQAPGQKGHKATAWGGGRKSTYKAPNAIPVAKGQWEKARPQVARLQHLLDDAQKEDSASSGDDLAGQLKGLAGLHSAGALTDEEFEAGKRKLIGG